MAARFWVGGAGTWDAATTTNWSATSGGAGGASAPTAADDVTFNAASSGAAYAVTISTGATCRNWTAVGPAVGNVTFQSTGAMTIAGSVSLSAAVTYTHTGLITFTATTAQTLDITPAITCPFTFAGVAGVWQLQRNLTTGTTRTVTLTNGTIDLNNFALSAGQFQSANSNARSIAFGATGKVVMNSTTATLTMSIATNFSTTGTTRIEWDNVATAGANTRGAQGGHASLNFYVINGGGIWRSNGMVAGDIDLTGFTGAITPLTSCAISGNYTIPATATVTASATAGVVFAGTAGVQAFRLNGVAHQQPITISGVGGTVKLMGVTDMGNTRTLTLTNGTIDLNGQTLKCGTFSSSNANARTIKYNGGTIDCSTVSCATTNNLTLDLTGGGLMLMPSSTAAANTAVFTSGAATWPNLTYSYAGGPGDLTVTAAAVTFGTITCQQAMTWTQSGTITAGVLDWDGASPAARFNLRSSVPGTARTLSVAAGTVHVTNCSIQDSTATGGARFEAQLSDGNQDLGNNLGWYFGIGAVTEAGAAASTQGATIGVSVLPGNTAEVGNAVATVAALLNAPRAIAEAGNALATTSATLSAPRAVAEVAAASSTQGSSIAATRATVEAGAAVDTRGGSIHSAVARAEVAAAADTCSATLNANVTRSDAMAGTDLISAFLMSGVSTAEVMHAVDTLAASMQMSVQIAEVAAAIATQGINLAMSVATAEGMAGVDTTDRILSMVVETLELALAEAYSDGAVEQGFMPIPLKRRWTAAALNRAAVDPRLLNSRWWFERAHNRVWTEPYP